METPTPQPKSDLAKLLLVLVQVAASVYPQAFKEIDVAKALVQADAVVDDSLKT